MLQKNLSQEDITKISQIILDKGISKKSKHILITGLCNNNCVFCFSEGILKKQHKSLRQIKKELKEGIKEGCEKLVISGGEPAIHPNFLEVLEEGKKAGYKSISIITNGRMFSYQDFLDRAISKGLDEINFSIHAHTPELGDFLSGIKGSFQQSINGLKNALKSRLCVQVKIALNNRNLRHLAEIIDYFVDLGVKNFEILNLVPEGNAWKNRKELFFDMELHAGYLCSVFQMMKNRNVVLNLNRFNSEAFKRFINTGQQKLKKFNELSIRKKDFLGLLEGREFHCFGEKCNYCFIRNECSIIRKSILTGKKSNLEMDSLSKIIKEAIKDS